MGRPPACACSDERPAERRSRLAGRHRFGRAARSAARWQARRARLPLPPTAGARRACRPHRYLADDVCLQAPIGMSIVLSASSPAKRGVEPRAELRTQARPATSGLPTLQGHAAVAELEKRGMYGSLQQALEAAHYRVYQERQHAVAWYAENPAQRIRARFTPDGVQLQATPRHGDARRIDMKLRSVGYGKRQIGVGAARLSAADNRIEYRRSLLADDAAGGDVSEWYVNTPAGLEQGFTIESAPGERREGERLRMTLALEGELRAQTVDGEQALVFADAAGNGVLRYGHLMVRDARGRELEARMAVRLERRDLARRGRSRRRLAGDHRPVLHPAAEARGLGRVRPSLRLIGGNQRGHRRGRHARGRHRPRSRLGLCLCAQRWHLDRAAEADGVGRGGR